MNPYLPCMANSLSDPDVLVIGAGAAGLAAARTLVAAGVRTTVVEARDRAGGRGWTAKVGPATPVDLGCGWLHSAETNPLVPMAESLGKTIDRAAAPWQKPADPRSFPSEDQREFRDAWAAFYDRLDAAALSSPDRPASDFLEPGNRWNGLLNAGSTFINGVELGVLSVVDFGRYADTGVNWRVPDGFGALMARIGEGLPIMFGCAATKIDHTGKKIRVETRRGVVRAGAVIVTVPTTLIARETLAFDPRLPEKIRAAQALPLGLADKLFLAVENAEDLPFEARIYGRKDRAEIAGYHLRPFGQPLIECYFGGQFARDLEAGGMEAFASFAIGEIADVFGGAIRKRLTAVACSAWASDPWALGSYSHARIGCSDERSVLAAPVDGRIFFAGEATSRHDFSTAHGAWRTGLAAAREAIAVIG